MTQRAGRLRAGKPVCAVVGYTNAGKSSLVSALSGDDVGVQDRWAAYVTPYVTLQCMSGAVKPLTNRIPSMRQMIEMSQLIEDTEVGLALSWLRSTIWEFLRESFYF